MLFRTLFIAAFSLILCGSALAAERVIVVAHDATWPPMEYIGSDKQLIGYSVDYIDAVAKEAGFQVKHRNVAWAGIFGELAAGKCDVIASSVTITPERQKAMDFSIPYYKVQQAVIVPKDSAIKQPSDLENKTIGAQISTTGYFAAREIKGATPKSYDAVGLAIEDLLNKRLDAVICDDPVAADFALKKAENAEKLHIVFVIEDAEVEFYGFAVKKGNTAVLDLLNKGVTAVKEKGIEAQLIQKWIGK